MQTIRKYGRILIGGIIFIAIAAIYGLVIYPIIAMCAIICFLIYGTVEYLCAPKKGGLDDLVQESGEIAKLPFLD